MKGRTARGTNNNYRYLVTGGGWKRTRLSCRWKGTQALNKRAKLGADSRCDLPGPWGLGCRGNTVVLPGPEAVPSFGRYEVPLGIGT